jgi:hypothetical protein
MFYCILNLLLININILFLSEDVQKISCVKILLEMRQSVLTDFLQYRYEGRNSWRNALRVLETFLSILKMLKGIVAP